MERAYLAIDSRCYLEIHENSEGDWDYTLYNFHLDEIDGGVVAGFLLFQEALNHISSIHELSGSMEELDHDTFETIRWTAKELKDGNR